MPELETRLRRYATSLDHRYPDVSAAEVMEKELAFVPSPPVVSDQRKGWVIASAAVLGFLLLAGGFGLLTKMVGPPGITAASPPDPASDRNLGVFESIRGWIVYTIDGGLEAVNPVDPSERHRLEVFRSLDGRRPMAAGWSSDGSKFAVSSEHEGKAYVVDASGTTTSLKLNSGCCGFVTTNWLSPDGSALVTAGPGPTQLSILDLDDNESRHIVELEDSDASYLSGMAWSPDGTEIAFIAERESGEFLEPVVQVVAVGSGAVRQLVGPEFGHVRHLAWSPDGTQLALIAGDFRFSPRLMNPLMGSIPTTLYLVRADGSARMEISSGHYLAVAWSPDGSQLAVVDYRGNFQGNREVVVMSADGGGQEVVAELRPSELFTGVAWHPVP